MFGKKRKLKPIPPLNLVPIMDAVFIFIFFLLLSAQFVDIKEINSDAPSVAMVKDNQLKKEPLNLTLEIKETEIIIKTGLSGNPYKKVAKVDGKNNLEQLRQILIDLKKNNIGEVTANIKPDAKVVYEDVISVLDVVRSLPSGHAPIVGRNDKGVLIETNMLFEEIVFETII
jgi:biopolymer transport protein ExbD